MRRIGVFVDISNLYYSICNEYGKKTKINFHSYMAYVEDLGKVTIAVAHGAQIDKQAKLFLSHLRGAGFTTKYKQTKTYQNNKRKGNCDIDLTVDVIRNIDAFDMLILGSADGDFAPLVKYVKDRGKQVMILACGISGDLKHLSDYSVEMSQLFLNQT